MSKSYFTAHSSEGLSFQNGFSPFGENSSGLSDIPGKVKVFTSSACGSKFAWILSGKVHIVAAPSWKQIGCLTHPRAQEILFSPKGNYLAVWETYVKTEGQQTPNLTVYDVEAKKVMKAFFQQSQINWEPQWSKDESIFARSVSTEVHFYEANNLQNIVQKKILPKIGSFSLSPSIDNHLCTFFVPSIKGAPSYVHLYKYPDFSEASRSLANKSFYKVDTVESFWNSTCTGVLLLTTAETDKSGQSYYGEQMLFLLTTSGDASRITFSKAGNIRSVNWCPNGKEFFAVYGASPAKTTLFNSKCDPVAEFGEGARNTVLVNPVGNIVMIGGFGNISSRFELYDIATRREIGRKECPDITHIEWSPCGQYLLTSTCTPRLRVNNGYKIWHYTAALVHEKLENELFRASWISDPNAAVPFKTVFKKVAEIQSEIKTASTQRYIPPSQRAAMANKGASASTEKRFLSQQEESANPVPEAQLSKSALKNKKKREAAKKKKDQEKNEGGSQEKAQATTHEKPQVELTGDPDKDKKIRNLTKKLDAIAKLKADKKSGKTLEKNQLEKINTESSLIKELEQLRVG